MNQQSSDYTEFIEQFYFCNKCNQSIPGIEELENHLEDEHGMDLGFN